MTRNTLGFLVAPLAAPVAFLVLMLVRGDGGQGGDGAGTSLFWLMVLAVIAAYVVTALFGLPLHLLLRRTGCRACAWYMAGGALIALVPFLPGLLSGKHLAEAELMLMTGAVPGTGLITGLLFWFIAVRGRSDRQDSG